MDPTSSSTSSSSSSDGSAAVQVVVRLRPMNEREQRHGTVPVISAKTLEKVVTVVKGKGRKQVKSTYSFDNVFTAFSTQEEVFEETVKPVIADVMRGYESTVFAYGQTGTGKTHTMEGSLERPDLFGVIPRSAQAIFECLKQPQYKEQVVKCSYLEIYNEELRDLLVEGKDRAKLDIMEGKDGTFCRGLTEIEVRSASDVLHLIQRGQHQRMIGETKMNKSSSRSHSLFTIQIDGKISLLDGDGDMGFTGKLHMVDLAGSECAKAAGNEMSAPEAVARERERMNINRSLLTLGRVITILKEKSLNKNVNARIPYRDSKLTRVLQESLGGRCKTVVVATISPSITAIEESISTLNYAQSACGIVNKPISSSSIAFGDMPNFFDKSSSGECTVESWQEMEMRLQYMQTQVDEAQAALARKHIQQQELQDKVNKYELKLLEKQRQLYDAEKENKALKGVVETETRKRKEAEVDLRRTQIDLKKTTLILKATQATELSLTAEAQSIITKLEEIIADRNDMHSLVLSQRDEECQRRQEAVQFQQDALVLLGNINSSFSHLLSNIESSQSDTIEIATENHKIGGHFLAETQKLLSEISENVVCVTDSIKTLLSGEEGILSSVKSSSDSILLHMQASSEAFIKGEVAVEVSCETIRKRLNESSKLFDERSSYIQSSTNQTLQRLEEKVVESKNAISHLVLRMKSLITNLSQTKAEKVKELDMLVEQWRDESVNTSKSLNILASTSMNSYKASFEEFENGMLSHEEIAKSLEDQRSFVSIQGAAHVQSIGQQSSILQGHCDNLKQSHRAQTQLLNETMSSIMSGVQALVKLEMEKLASAETDHFKVLMKGGADLTVTNKAMYQSAHEVIENMNSTNQRVSEKALLVQNNDLKANKIMKSVCATMQEVANSSSIHHQLATEFASKSLSVVSDIKIIDEKNAEVVNTAERDGKTCSACIVNGVFKPTVSDMKKTAKSSLEAMTFMSTSVIPDINGSLDDVASNRKLLASQMSESFQSAENHLSTMRESVKSIAKTQYDVADTLERDILSASDVHSRSSMASYSAELDSAKNKLVSTMTGMRDTCTRLISDGKDQSTTVSSSINDFSINKMRCGEPVNPAPAKRDSSFSHKLSSTPAIEMILESHEFDVSKPSDASKPLAGEVARRPQSPTLSDRDCFQESQDDDNKSVHSAGSVASIPIPRLSYRDINVIQEDSQRADKSSNHHLATGSSGGSIRKTKLPSGLPNPLKKRVKR